MIDPHCLAYKNAIHHTQNRPNFRNLHLGLNLAFLDCRRISLYLVKNANLLCLYILVLRCEFEQTVEVRYQHLYSVEGANNPTGLFINVCKKEVKPQKSQVSNEVNKWFTWARKERIVIAMTGDVAYTPNGKPVSMREMMELHPMRE